MPKGEKTLREVISGSLGERIGGLWALAENFTEYQEGDGPNRLRHCQMVENNLGKIIPEANDGTKKEGFSEFELFILSAGACLHDIGRIQKDWPPGWPERHDRRSQRIILERRQALGLNRAEARAAGWVVGVHDTHDLTEIPEEIVPVGHVDVNVVKLAAVLSLADMLDTTCQRLSDTATDILYEGKEIPEKIRARRAITGWTLDENSIIELQALPQQDELDAALTAVDMFTEELAKFSPQLKRFGLPSEVKNLEIDTTFLDIETERTALQERPFPGMGYYTRKEANIFCGRDEEIKKLIALTHANPISLLVGESGAGKTSLIQAGIFPRLERIGWHCLCGRPIPGAAYSIRNALTEFAGVLKITLDGNTLEIVRAIAGETRPRKFLLVLDQFEDVMKIKAEEEEDLFRLLLAVQGGTALPNVRVLFSFRDDAWVKLSARWLKNITGSARQFPSLELERLSKEGAKAALEAGLSRGNLWFEPKPAKTEIESTVISDEKAKSFEWATETEEIIEEIIKELTGPDGNIYPPDIQMVAETLCKYVDASTGMISRLTYFEDLGGAKNIVANYLINSLEDFGPDKEKAVNILVSLTTSAGAKSQLPAYELALAAGLSVEEIEPLLINMVSARMVRRLSSEEYEIIHDHLGALVAEKLVNKEEHDLKVLTERLESYNQAFMSSGTPVTDMPFLANMYANRFKIKLKDYYYRLLFSSCVSDNYLGWFWLSGLTVDKIRNIALSLIDCEYKKIKAGVAKALGFLSFPEDVTRLAEIAIKDDDRYVKETATESLKNIVTIADKPKIMRIIDSKDETTKSLGLKILHNIAGPEDRDLIIGFFDDESQAIRCSALYAFKNLVKPGDADLIIDRLSNWGIYSEGETIIEILKNIANKEAKERLAGLVYSDVLEHSVFARDALQEILSEADMPLIEDLIRNDRRFFGYGLGVGILALAKSGSRLGFEMALTNMDNESSFVRESSRTALAYINERDFRDPLLEFARSGRPRVASKALKALLNMAIPEDRELILSLLPNLISEEKRPECSPYFRDAQKLAKPLSLLYTVTDKPLILQLLKSEDIILKYFAAKTLINLASYEEKDILYGVLENDIPIIQSEILKTLVKILPDTERPELLDFLAARACGWSERHRVFFRLLSITDHRFYCPYAEKENRRFQTRRQIVLE